MLPYSAQWEDGFHTDDTVGLDQEACTDINANVVIIYGWPCVGLPGLKKNKCLLLLTRARISTDFI